MEIRQSFRLIAFLLIGYFLGFMLFSCTTLQSARNVVYTEEVIRSNLVQLVGERGMGTGVRISTDKGTYILTAKHTSVLAVLEQMQAILPDGRTTLLGIIAVSPEADLMLLTAPPGPPGLRIAKSVNLHARTRAIGFAHGYSAIVSEGEIVCYSLNEFCTSLGAPTASGLLTMSTAWHVPGMSGGPVVDSKGYITGIVKAYNTEDPRFGYDVTLFDIQEFLKDY